MNIACGTIFGILGILSFFCAMVFQFTGEHQRASAQELCGIGWFILAALCFRS